MSRVDDLRALMDDEGLDGFLVTEGHNRRYLSGFTGSAGVLIVTAEVQALATDSRYYEQVRQQCPDWQLIEVGYDFAGNLLEILRDLGLGGRTVGFEATHVPVATLHAWERNLQGRLVLVNTENSVEELRIRKDTDEVARLKKAIALADETMAYIIQWLQPGMTEKQVAWEIESYMRRKGASALSFPPIVASGPNSALPHAEPSERVIQAGEPLILDFGCIVEGYCSDITRSFCLGEPQDERYLQVWQTVLEAQQAAESSARGGMTGEAVDKIARDIINGAGYEENYGHGLGHGVGLAVHERPRYSFTYPHEVPSGATVTVEPGVYIPGWGGVRLEDIVLVRDEGLEVLTQSPKLPVVE